MNAAELRARFSRPYWLGETEVPYLFHKAGCTNGPIVEIGAAYGGSTVLFLLGKRPGVQVVSIDAFVEDPHTHFRASETECRAAVRQAVGEELLADWTLIARPSAEAAVVFRPMPIALFYVDGDHSYAGVHQDVSLWARHLAADGRLILHDSRRLPGADPRVFARGWPGPTRVAEELVASGAYEVLSSCYSMTELRRTP